MGGLGGIHLLPTLSPQRILNSGMVKKQQIPLNYRVFFAKRAEICRFLTPHELTEFRIGLVGGGGQTHRIQNQEAPYGGIRSVANGSP